MSHFFDTPWSAPFKNFDISKKAVLYNWAGFNLRALGRLDEASEAMQNAIQMLVNDKAWKRASLNISNLSQLQEISGKIESSINSRKLAIEYADKTDDLYQKVSARDGFAHILHQRGRSKEASVIFHESDLTLKEHSLHFFQLGGVSVFYYSELLLDQNNIEPVIHMAINLDKIVNFREVILDVALRDFILGRAYFLKNDGKHQAHEYLIKAITGFREAGTLHYLPYGLLIRTNLYYQSANFSLAQKDLQDTYEIAEPSGMRLHLTDYHLEMARLILAIEADPDQYKEATPDREQRTLPTEIADPDEPGILTLQGHIQAANKLIQDTGYHRRDAELAELKQQAGMSC